MTSITLSRTLATNFPSIHKLDASADIDFMKKILNCWIGLFVASVRSSSLEGLNLILFTPCCGSSIFSVRPIAISNVIGIVYSLLLFFPA